MTADPNPTGPNDELIRRYMSAWRAANPNNAEAPTLKYERGWFAFRYRMSGGVPTRVRRAELWDMLKQTETRANGKT